MVVTAVGVSEAGRVAGGPESFPVTYGAPVAADFPPLLRGIGVDFDAVAIGVACVEAAGDVVVRDAKGCTGVGGSAVTLDQVGLTLKLEGQVIQGGGGGVPEDGDIVVGVAVAEEAPNRGPMKVSRGGLAVDLLDADYTIVEVEGPFDVGDEKVGVPEPSGAEEGGLTRVTRCAPRRSLPAFPGTCAGR